MSEGNLDRYEPTEQELKARKKRNIAIGLLLAIFVIIVFVTLVSKGIVIRYGNGEAPDAS